MAKNLTIRMLLLSTLLLSCNRVLLLKKSKVLHQQEGYLFDQENQQFFIPMNVEQSFLSQVSGKKAYLIGGDRSKPKYLYNIADSIKVNMHFNVDAASKDTFSMEEKVFVTRVRIAYTSYEPSQLLQNNQRENPNYQNGNIKFDYLGKTYSFASYLLFDGDIYRITTLDSIGQIIYPPRH